MEALDDEKLKTFGEQLEDDEKSGNTKEENGQALALKWTFGYNKLVPGSVHNLSDDSRNAIFYFAAHTGVVYDYVNRTQTLLQGHCNPISCSAVSADKRWIATADSGKDSMIVVWDSFTGAPLKTIFNPHQDGVIAIDFSPDALFLATLSKPFDNNQHVAVWEWTTGHDLPIFESEIPKVDLFSNDDEGLSSFTPKRPRAGKRNGRIGDRDSEAQSPTAADGVDSPLPAFVTPFQAHIRFNTFDVKEFVTTGSKHVTFWNFHKNVLEHQTPPQLRKSDFGSKVGDFTNTVFLSNYPKAVSSTTQGNLVLWDSSANDLSIPISSPNGLQSPNPGFPPSIALEDSLSTSRAGIKVVKLNRNGSIPFLLMHDELLVVCGEDESVRFYDTELRIVAWFEDLDAGPINSVSFSASSTKLHYVQLPFSESTNLTAASPNGQTGPPTFAITDFVASTSRALIVGVDAATFDDPSPDNRHGTLLLQGFDGPIACVVTHPCDNVFVSLSKSGIIQAWNYQEKRLLLVRILDSQDQPICAAFSSDGNFIAVGFHNGMLRIFRWGKLRDLGEIACFQIHGAGYTLLEFSPDSSFLACADKNHAVSLLRFVPSEVSSNGEPFKGVDAMKVNQGKRKSEPGPGLEPCDGSDSRNGWVYIGRYKSHKKPITCISFGIGSDNLQKLVSIAEDGYLVEYDLEQSSVVDGIQLGGSVKRIEFGSSIPTCCVFHPADRVTREDIVLTANTEFKIRSFNANNRSCRRTALGPTYGGPLTKLKVITRQEEGTILQYLAYCTSEKVIGLIKFPFDGNPYKTMGLIAHPGEITGFTPTHDGRFLLSAGGSDMCINVWAVNTRALDSTVIAAGSQVAPGVSRSLVPFLPLIEGGYQGELYEEIVDFFYYTQLRCQGEETTSPRRTEGYVPLTEIPNLMRALGFYPTEQEIENMCSEIRYSEFATNAKTVDIINLEQFIKLYINHRPVVGITKDQVVQSFKQIQRFVEPGPESIAMLETSVEWKSLKKLLETMAEAMPPKELETCLTMLIGRKGITGLKPNTYISVDRFAGDILGLRDDASENREEEQKFK